MVIKLLTLLIVGFIVSVGWHLGKIIGFVASDIVEARVKRSKWYMAAMKPKQVKMNKPMDNKPYCGTTMGFVARREES